MAALLEWVQDDPRNLFSMFFQRDYAEQDWVMEADLYKDEDPHCPECQAVAGFCDLIHHSYVVAVNGDNDCGMCGYLFQDPNGQIHTAYDDDAGILVLYAFRDKAAAAAAFELYIHSPEYRHVPKSFTHG